MNKTTRIISIVLMVLSSLLLLMSAVMKLMQTKEVVEAFAKMGLSNYVVLIGVIELVAIVLFVIPKTTKIGFLLLCSYLGGAISIELAIGEPPTAAILLAVIWISVYLRNKGMFLHQPVKTDNIIT